MIAVQLRGKHSIKTTTLHYSTLSRGTSPPVEAVQKVIVGVQQGACSEILELGN